MPGLLGPTNPVPGFDPNPNRIQPPQPGDTNVQNIVDPTRVVRPDGRTDSQQQQDAGDAASYAARFDSSFGTFFQRLRGASNLAETFMTILHGMGTEVTSGIREGFAKEMSEFLEFIELDETELLDFLQNQVESSSRFSGPLFQALREAYSESQSNLVQNDILQFLRRFSDFSSTEHLENKILREVFEMTESLPSPWTGQVSDILAKLQNSISAGDRNDALKLLKEQLFPMMSRYVSLTHDHGRARNIFSFLSLDAARYENGSEEGLIQSFRQLVHRGVVYGDMARMTEAEVLEMLTNTEYNKTAASNNFADRLANITHKALQGHGGADTQEVFHSVLNAMLINESVYMPLQHIMLPLIWNGERMFSEMWVDPDADRSSRQVSDGHGTLRILIKMDVESLGAFDILINARNENVALQVACPASVAPYTDQVSRAMSTILERNGLRAEQVSVGEMRRPVAVSDIFPKIMERMRGVNVKV